VPYRTIYLCDSSTNQEIGSNQTNDDGYYSFTLHETEPHTYYAHFKGDSQNKPRTSENVVVNVLSLKILNTGLAIFAPQTVPLQTVPLEKDPLRAIFTLSGYLKQTSSGQAARNQTIHFYNKTNQEFASTQTDEQGYYSFTWYENSTGAYDYYARFEGNSQNMSFRSETVTVKVSVQNALPTYLAFFGPLYLVQQGADFTLSGSLQQACTWNFLSNQIIHLYKNSLSVNNQEIGSAQTDESGLYSFTWHESSPGTYTYYARYEGNSTYAPFRSEMVTVTVTS
jgi:hypothetical protein